MSDFSVKISIQFPTARETDIAYQVLRVDAEPRRSGVTKTLELNDDILNVSFTGSEASKVRVGLTSFFDSLILLTETMKEFDGRAPVYDYY
ncbi:EKC/KEOPS complex subunit LAGE3 [Chelonus insularis]|uniref:EKC/KEOPS complex subunit LAGE3 n=1 Tax=Chelonus insularis TaxID=460826 RepID=UPI00158D79D5|nr:EKC/KEOPS complex subunit LAGE3 [Chelonus insularis]